MRFKFDTAEEATPKGKRSIRANEYGNLWGYVSGKRWVEFGEEHNAAAQRDAAQWLNGGEPTGDGLGGCN